MRDQFAADRKSACPSLHDHNMIITVCKLSLSLLWANSFHLYIY